MDFSAKQLTLQRTGRQLQSYDGRSQNTAPYPSPKSPMSYSSEIPQPQLNFTEREETERYAYAESPTLINQPAADVEALTPPVVTYFTPNRRLPSGGTLLGGVTVMGLSSPKDSRRPKTQLNELLNDFTSPIGMSSIPADRRLIGMLTEMTDLVDREVTRQRG